MTDRQESESPAQGAPGQPGPGQPYGQPNPIPPAGWGSAPGAWPPPAANAPSKWFGPEWEAAMVKSAHRSIKNLIIGFVVFLVAIGFVIFAAVANNLDQVKNLLGMSSSHPAPSSNSSNSSTVSTKTAPNLKVGDCLADDPIGTISDVNVVSCSTSHAAEVVAVLTLPGGSFPDPSTIDGYKNKCADALDAYSSTSGQDPSIQLTTLTPMADDWSNGDHTMDCVASLSPPRTGSIKG
jgi:putative regulator of septum formation